MYLNFLLCEEVRRVLRRPRDIFQPQCDARNIDVRTRDGELLNGWHITPSDWQADDVALSRAGSLIILFLHGQAGCRGGVLQSPDKSARVNLMKKMAQHFNCNVICFDYRGFGDSTGTPSEYGLRVDAHAMFSWVASRVSSSSSVIIYGQSLGSAVACRLAADLCSQSQHQPSLASAGYKGLILDAAFTSATEAAISHPLFKGIFKVLPRPLCSLVLHRIPDRWESHVAIADITRPILFVHKTCDEVVPVKMGRSLAEVASRRPNRTGEATTTFIEIADKTKRMRRHHVDSFTTSDWDEALSSFFGKVCPVSISEKHGVSHS